VIHCGDWKSFDTVRYFADAAHQLHLPVKGVLGNNDRDSQEFLEFARLHKGDFSLNEGVLKMQIGNKKVAVYHGHHKPTLRKVLLEITCGIILLGHTHKPFIESTDNRLLVNPGSTAFAIPRSKTWRPTVALVDTERLTASIHYLNEIRT